MRKYGFILCILLCLTGCTTHVNLNTPEQTQEQTTSEYATQENITEDCTTQENITQENTTQDNTTSVVETTTWEDTTTENNTETPSFSETDNIMHKVLLNEAMFMDIDSGQMMYAEDLEGFTNPKDYPYGGVKYFNYVDLDGNGECEVIIELYDHFGTKKIFYIIDNIVYAEAWPFRGMNPLYEDGTMHSSNGAANSEIIKIISLDKDGIKFDIAVGSEGTYDGIVIYYTGSEENEITEEEYNTILNSYSKVVAEEYKFNEENIRTIIKYKDYIIDNELLEYSDDKISWKLEYPVFNSESDQYDKVNTLLVDEIKKLTELPYVAKEFEGRFYYTGRYEIFEQSSDVISLCYVISIFHEHAASPFVCCYGLTVDIETAEMIALSAYVEDINKSLTEIEKGNYTVSYGAFSVQSSDEVKIEVEKAFSECELSKSYNSFYIDDGNVCFIVNDVVGSDYSVIRMNESQE